MGLFSDMFHTGAIVQSRKCMERLIIELLMLAKEKEKELFRLRERSSVRSRRLKEAGERLKLVVTEAGERVDDPED